MSGVHILGGRYKPAAALSAMSERASFSRVFSLVLVITVMLGAASCVGVTGKTATGDGNSASATVTPSSANFGNVPVHTNAARSFTLTNTGTIDLTITRLSGSGLGYSTGGGGLNVNTIVKAGSSLHFVIHFTPAAAGNVPGNISITTSADSTPLTVTLDGTGVAAPGGTPAIDITPSSVNFGNVPLHTRASRSLTLTNTGTTDLTVTKLSEAGQGYSTGGGGLNVNTIVKAGSSLHFSIYFSPLVTGNAPGSLSVTTTAESAPLTVTLDGTGVAAPGGTPAIDITPSSVNFGNVTAGTTDTQTMRLANTGTADLKITKISASGTGFSVSGLSIPETLPAGKSTTFTASFKPAGTGAHTGSIAISSNASGSPLSVSMTGSGVTTNTKLSASTTSVNFGPIKVGSASSQNVLLTNTGNTNVTISSVATVGTGFAATGGVNATLTPNQSIDVAISFDPKAPGGVAGTLTISSNAPTLHVALAGQGAGPVVPHSVSLSWAPSISAVVGYNVYRGSVSGGPYSRLNPSEDSLTSYTDHSPSGGQKYYYVVTAIESSGIESGFSNQASVTIPSP
jgi:hypothetical protein